MLLPPLSKLPGYRPRYGYPDDVPEFPGESLPGDFSAAQLDNREQGPIMPPPVPPAPRPEVESTGPQMLALNSPPQMPDPKAPLIGAKAFKTPQPPPVPPAPKVLPDPPAVDLGPPKPPQLALNLPPRFQPKAPVVSINAGQDEGIASPAPDFNYNSQAFPKNGGAIPETKPLGSPMEQYQGLKRPMRPGYKLDDQGNVVDDPKTAPKWYQKLAAAALGAGAGWVNADGRAKIDPRQTSAAVEGIAAPGYAGKVAEYEGRKQDLSDNVGMEIQKERYEGLAEQRKAVAEQRKAQAAKYEQDSEDKASAIESREKLAAEERQRKSFNAYTDGGKLPVLYRPEGEPPVAGWERVPLSNPDGPKGMVAFIPPRIAPLPKELVPYAAGRFKEGDMVDRGTLSEYEKTYRTEVEKRNLQDNAAANKDPGNEVALAIAAARGDKDAASALELLVKQKQAGRPQSSPGITLTPEAVAFWAQAAAGGTPLPSMGMGAAGAAARGQIINAAPQFAGGNPLAANRADVRADTGSLTNMQKNLDAVKAFENTASANLDIFTKAARSVIDSGSPWINEPLRAIDKNGLGSGELAAYDAARQVALTEIAKVVSNPNLSSVLSDSARREVMGLLPERATLKQIYDVVNVLKQDMASRHKFLDKQVKEIRDRMRGGNTGTGGPEGSESQEVVWGRDASGKPVRVSK